MKESTIPLSKNEMWKILDAIKAYQKNYALTAPTNKLLDSVEKKLNNYLENN